MTEWEPLSVAQVCDTFERPVCEIVLHLQDDWRDARIEERRVIDMLRNAQGRMRRIEGWIAELAKK